MKNNFINGIRLRDANALEYAIEKFTPIVTSVVNKVLMPYGKETCEECVSDVFVSIWWNIERFKGEEKDFKNWICAVARFKAIDYYRKVSKEENIIEIDAAMSPDILEEIIDNENREEALETLKVLKEEDRKIFFMRFFLGMKVKEISEKVNLSESIVSNRIYKGKERLKGKVLKEDKKVEG